LCFNIGVNFYESLLKPLLFCLDPEEVHHLAIRCLRHYGQWNWLPDWPGTMGSGGFKKTVFGIEFPNPIGLAAGFDKNAVAVPAWAKLGFGFVEVGTITALVQPGNPRPRIFRRPEVAGLINRLGFNNDGVEVIAQRIERERPRWPKVPVGINLGKSKVTPLESAVEDYVKSFRRTVGVGDYFVLNVSSPNTPGLRKLQERTAIGELFAAIQAINPGKPLLVKIAPDLSEGGIEDVLELVETHRLSGLIATNTTIDQAVLPENRREQGGLSGAPVRARALEVLRFLKQRTQLPVISVGGILSADDAKARFDEGAELIQIYTGLIYRGPALIGEILASMTASIDN
jgi:dihydroorotate dehydrogenase